MAASGNLSAQTVIAFDIGLGFTVQGQCLWRVQWRAVYHLTVDQAVQQVQDMRLGRHTLGQRQFHYGENGLFVVVQHEGQDIDHFPITARCPATVCLQTVRGGVRSICSCTCLNA